MSTNHHRKPRATRVLCFAVGSAFFLLTVFWLAFVWLAFNLAEVADWITCTTMVVPTAAWSLLWFLFLRSVMSGRRRQALATGGLIVALALGGVLLVALHHAVAWPF